MNKERTIKSIPIIGLDKSSPANLAPLGSCDDLCNLRYLNNAWRSTMPQKEITRIKKNSSYPLRLLYHHPACPDNLFIAAFAQQGVSSIGVIDVNSVNSQEVVEGATILWEDVGYYGKEFQISHFGKVLIITLDGVGRYFVWDTNEGKYSEYITPQPIAVTETFAYGKEEGPELTGITYGYQSYYAWRIYNENKNIECREVGNRDTNMWWGELCYLVCYKMTDGTIVSPSALRIICSERTDDVPWKVARVKSFLQYLPEDSDFSKIEYETEWVLCRTPKEDVEISDARIARFLPTLNISLPKDIENNPLINRVAIYATRINPIFDYDKLMKQVGFFGELRWPSANAADVYRNLVVTGDESFLDISQAYADHHLPEQPFYLIEEREVKSILKESKNRVWNVELGYNKLKDVTSQIDIYTPNQSLHSIVSQVTFEYNNRLHMADVTTRMFDGYSNICHWAKDETHPTPYTLVKLNNGCRTKALQPTIIDSSKEIEGFSVMGNIISYPDSRAEQIELYNNHDTSHPDIYYSLDPFILRPALANNYAYYLFPPTNKGKYPNTGYYQYAPIVIPEPNPTIVESNRLQVSASGNCFNLPFDTSYTVGGTESHIKALNTVTEILADSRFGETPLYVFTDKGIWAAIVGSGEIVYSNWVLINLDRITRPITTAGNGVVFYITARGIHALQGRQATLISQPIEDTNSTEAEPWYIINMWLNHRYNELVVEQGIGKDWLTYSLDSQFWASRAPQGTKLNGNILLQEGNAEIILLDSEEESSNSTIVSQASIRTRPFELTPMHYTRIEALWARLLRHVDFDPVTIILEGASSPKPDKWIRLREITSSNNELGVIRGVPSSARWYRITLIVTATKSLSLTHFDIEFYNKYLRRLR